MNGCEQENVRVGFIHGPNTIISMIVIVYFYHACVKHIVKIFLIKLNKQFIFQ